jgi:hypothetical protein
MPVNQGVPSRFVDVGKYLSNFADEVHVCCVRCCQPGVVLAHSQGWRWNAQFDCHQCQLRLRTERCDWVGPIRLHGRRPCGYCGHKWLEASKVSQWLKKALTTASVECVVCKHVSSLELTSSRHYCAAAQDPHFGMPLRLIEAMPEGELWVYNARHLAQLKAYVTAKLRERTANAGNSSMFSRLPSWIKKGKNREAVLKHLQRLENLLQSQRNFDDSKLASD